MKRREPQLERRVDHLAQTIQWYTNNADQYIETIEAWMPEELGTFLESIPEGGSILDIGCAGGRDTAAMASQGYKASGIDISAGMIKSAQRRNPDISFTVGDVCDLSNIPDSSLDGVWARAVLLHMETDQDVNTALSEIARITKDGAPVHIHVKAKTGSAETAVVKDSLTNSPRFFRYFTLEQLQQKLEQHGFESSGLKQYQQGDRPDVQWISGIVRKASQEQ